MVGGHNGPALVDFFPNDVTSKTDTVAKRIAEEVAKQRAVEAEKARVAKLETDFKTLEEEKKKLVEGNSKLGLEKQNLESQVKTLTETKNKWDEAEKKKLDDDNNLDPYWHGATVTILNCASKLAVDAGHENQAHCWGFMFSNLQPNGNQIFRLQKIGGPNNSKGLWIINWLPDPSKEPTKALQWLDGQEFSVGAREKKENSPNFQWKISSAPGKTGVVRFQNMTKNELMQLGSIPPYLSTVNPQTFWGWPKVDTKPRDDSKSDLQCWTMLRLDNK